MRKNVFINEYNGLIIYNYNCILKCIAAKKWGKNLWCWKFVITEDFIKKIDWPGRNLKLAKQIFWSDTLVLEDTFLNYVR